MSSFRFTSTKFYLNYCGQRRIVLLFMMEEISYSKCWFSQKKCWNELTFCIQYNSGEALFCRPVFLIIVFRFTKLQIEEYIIF